MDVRAEMNRELRRARGWLLAVTIIMVGYDVVSTVAGPELTDSGRKLVYGIIGGEAVLFLSLWWFTPRKPRLCLSLALVLFWLIQLGGAYGDPMNLVRGLLLKVLFTVALVNGIRSAGRAELLRDQLTQVFD